MRSACDKHSCDHDAGGPRQTEDQLRSCRTGASRQCTFSLNEHALGELTSAGIPAAVSVGDLFVLRELFAIRSCARHGEGSPASTRLVVDSIRTPFGDRAL